MAQRFAPPTTLLNGNIHPDNTQFQRMGNPRVKYFIQKRNMQLQKVSGAAAAAAAGRGGGVKTFRQKSVDPLIVPSTSIEVMKSSVEAISSSHSCKNDNQFSRVQLVDCTGKPRTYVLCRNSLSSDPSKRWQSDLDLPCRRLMIWRIMLQIGARKPNATTGYARRLPKLAKQLEQALYFNSESLEEYSNVDTFPDRLDRLVRRICGRELLFEQKR